MAGMLLAELTAATDMSLGLVLALAGTVGGALATSLVSRTLNTQAIKTLTAEVKQLKDELSEEAEERTRCQREHTTRLTTLEKQEAVRKALEEASQSSRSGTLPYPRSRT